MRLIKIKNIEKKDIPLYYRNEYNACSEFNFPGEKIVEVALSFSVEMVPTGEKLIGIQIKESVDYPLVPILRALKEEIGILEKAGHLL